MAREVRVRATRTHAARDAFVAQQVYSKVVRRHLRFGTTTCAYYGTIHKDATLVLCEVGPFVTRASLTTRARAAGGARRAARLRRQGLHGPELAAGLRRDHGCGRHRRRAAGPSTQRSRAEGSLRATEDYVKAVLDKREQWPLVTPIITPRYSAAGRL